jgi:putative tryptophan/tyrosine transport system substrate-binding protein
MPLDQFRRRDFVRLLVAAGWPIAARAQQGERMRRVGVLMALTPSDPEAQLRVNALEAGLRDLGWVEGRNLRIDYRWAPGDANALRAQAVELINSTPDLILAHSTPVVAALRQDGLTVPIVFVQVTDPVGSGFVPNFTRPGGHLTGFTSFEFTIGSKWLEALKLVAPAIGRIALLFNPDMAPYAPQFWQPVKDAAPSFDVTPMQIPVRDVAEIEHAIAKFAGDGGGGLMVLPDVSATYHRDLIIALAARHRLPAVYPLRVFAASGGLMSYGSDVAAIYRRAAGYVDRIFKGAVAGDLPVQAPDKFELVINLKTATALGLTVPPLLLGRADEVIE